MELNDLISHCPRCGKPIQLKEDRLIDCSSCSFTLYLAPSACNGAILTNETGEILLVKRAVEPKKGFWDLPGGFMNFDENIEESVLREIKEELDTVPQEIKYFKSYSDIYAFKDVTYHTLGLVFVGRIDPKHLQPHDDVSSFAFFNPEDLPFETLAFASVKQALKDYLGSLHKPIQTEGGK